MDAKDVIRRDIWSVKLWESALEPAQFVHSRMFYAAHLAHKFVRDERLPSHAYKIVHPAQWVVEAFVAAGNTIEGIKVTNPL